MTPRSHSLPLSEMLISLTVLLLGLKSLRLFPGLSTGDKRMAAALLLLTLPLLHLFLKNTTNRFFERRPGEIFHSLRVLGRTSLLIFPAFLLLSHAYQHLFLHHSFHSSGRGWDYWLQTAITQLCFVAFPEEFFFRGYLQTQLRIRQGPLGAIFLTAFLFAFSHSLIILQWWHFAIFFPACVFGWLREKTSGLLAPTLFHTFCNVLIFWVGSSYRP